MHATTQFDAISTELILTRLLSATDEAAEALRRTAMSTLVSESNDFAIVITDNHGNLLAQNSESIPAFIGTLPTTMKILIAEFRGSIAPGDVFATNDPWIASGHLNDITMVKPVFFEGNIAGYVGSCAHAPDIGGRKRSLESRDVHEEGFAIPPLRIISQGKLNDTFFRLYRAASRMPDESEADLWAAMSALSVVEARISNILHDYAMISLDEIGEAINSRSEAAMRQAIRAIPQGQYEYAFDTDGFDAPLHFHVQLTVRDDHINADFSGTSNSVSHAINCPMTYTFAMVAYALKCVLLPELPNCEGMLRCFSVCAPEGSIVNPLRPAPVAGRTAVGQYLPALALGALSLALPEKIAAMPGSPLWSCVITGNRPGKQARSTTLFFNGGMGATTTDDGECCFSFPSNVSGVPVELIEIDSPIFVHHKRLAENSGGVGRHRGGLGLNIRFEIEADAPVTLGIIAERCKNPADGLLGGEAGQPGHVLVDGTAVDHRRDLHLRRGQIIEFQTPGGGGLGPAGAREAQRATVDRQLSYTLPETS